MKKRLILIIGIICVLILAAVLGAFFLGEKSPENVQDDPVSDPGETAELVEDDRYAIDTQYIHLRFPKEYEEYIAHEQENTESGTAEVFYMRHEDGRMELFRIGFGDGFGGESLGVLNMADGTAVRINYEVKHYTAKELENIQVDYSTIDKDLNENNELYDAEDFYYLLLNEFNGILDSIRQDSRFSEGEMTEEIKSGKADLRYWDVLLPENMECVESAKGDRYQADFYGTVSDDKILLYSVYLNEEDPTIVLGNYKTGFTTRVVSVRSYELKMLDGWTEADMVTAGTMMDTINDVIGVITGSANFSR